MAQLDLFGSPVPPPRGFIYARDFITPDEERLLIERISELPLAPYQYGEYQAKRRVYNYGRLSDGTEAEPLPDWLIPFRDRAARFAGNDPEDIAQAHLIEYSPGSPIGWHRDSPPYDKVIGISLRSPCRFMLRREKDGDWERYEIEAEPRSAYVMAGPARSQWEHSIPPVEELRYSVTFRTIP